MWWCYVPFTAMKLIIFQEQHILMCFILLILNLPNIYLIKERQIILFIYLQFHLVSSCYYLYYNSYKLPFLHKPLFFFPFLKLIKQKDFTLVETCLKKMSASSITVKGLTLESPSKIISSIYHTSPCE